MRMRDGGVIMRSSPPSIRAGDHAPIRISQQPTTSGHAASGVAAAGCTEGTMMGWRGPHAVAAAAANRHIVNKARTRAPAFESTSILLSPRYTTSRGPYSGRNAQTLLARTRCLKPEFGSGAYGETLRSLPRPRGRRVLPIVNWGSRGG